MPEQQRRRRITGRAVAITGCASLLGSFVVAGSATSAFAVNAHPARASQVASNATAGNTCHLGNGIKHIVQIGFDNVHFFRDNPNVPSDLEMLPNLTNFIESNGTLLSNNHTPLIAHTGDDLLTTATGLYGDRHGDPIANDYQTYNPDGSTDSATVFTYWTDPIFDTASHPTAGHDMNPNLAYSPTPPATTFPPPKPDTVTPAPWVPYTRAGCNVGEVATVNQELENPTFDIPKVFGPHSPEAKQLRKDPDSFKDPETADYVGLAVHCAQGNALCKNAKAIKFGQTKPSHTAVADLLPDEPGGYSGFQALFGNKYLAPEFGGGQPNVTHNGFQVTNAAGNLVDENGNQINGAFLTNYPGFPGYGNINASQALAYGADMLENGVPVINMYMADLHGNEFIPSLSGTGGPCHGAPDALGSGSACYIAQAQYYNAAFGTFFKRLATDGITAKNTLFIVSSDEGDHEAGANVGRSIQPTPANCDGATVNGDTVTPDLLCTYPAGSFGELDANVTGLLATQEHITTPFGLEADTAPEFYLTGNPGPNTPVVRNFERGVGGLTADNPYAGGNQKIANYLAGPTEMAILHMVNADPARTPTFAMFARPDYYVQTGPATCGSSCVTQNTGFAWDHGDYAAEIDTNYVGFVGPGVRHLGLDGSAANQGPNSAGPNSGQVTIPDEHTKGPWADETDIRPTIMYLTGLKDDYEHDGRVITQILSSPNTALSAPGVTSLGECYKQLNSSVGDFGTDTLIASTEAVKSKSPGDSVFRRTNQILAGLDVVRDRLAETVKGELEAAAFQDTTVPDVAGQTAACHGLIRAAAILPHLIRHWASGRS
jgi:hypothetical protein